MNQLLEIASFRNRERALACSVTLASHLPEELLSRLFFLAASSADPDSVLHYLTRLQADNPQAFNRLIRNQNVLAPLVTLFSYSRFLSEEIIQHPEWLEDMVPGGDLHLLLSPGEMERRLEDFLASAGETVPSALRLAQFRRRQILRILLRDVMGLCTLAETTEELSNLADAIVDTACRHIRTDLVRRHGTPGYSDASGVSRECEFSIIALGKLGGQELNYSSDIDLMFVYTANGETDGARPITNKEFFKKVANRCTELLSTHTAEGTCYRVDLRLRPDGSNGEVCISLEGARQYYQTRGRDWELQMLIKARVAAGDTAPGKALLDFVENLIYSTTLDFSAVESVSEARERIQEKLQQKRATANEFDLKLASGGIRDIEFLVQCLQRFHGGREPWVRHGGTLLALFRLRDKGLLSDVECSRLASAYEFLRHLEHRLQFEDDRQTHTLPQDQEVLEILAQRMPAPELGSDPSAQRLLEKLDRHFRDVRELYERVIHAQQPTYYYGSVAVASDGNEQPILASEGAPDALDSNLMRFLGQRAPRFAAVLARTPLKRGGKVLGRYLEWVAPNAEWMTLLNSDPVLAGYLVDIFEHSSFFSDQLMRFPELIEELRKMRKRPGADGSPSEAAELEDVNDLRRFFRREMFRIQSESMCLATPIFTTLTRTSALADAALAAAYRIALAETLPLHPPVTRGYQPKDQMIVIALGRLGMSEFDLGSDADVVFVLADEDVAEHQFWTRVARKIIDRLSAYTGEGVIFAVDTRLRPNGRAGELVQTESTYKDYFSHRAEAWEGITYMKSRAVAGNVERGTAFLNQLQDLDWRRYGQSGRSQRQLRQMRMRLEKEQGTDNPLKAGFGGYYDIDFSLMYLRLKGAGIFFKLLNTPERIDVIEKMGHLERSDAAFLRDAAAFYRALDHGLRILSGHVEGYLPRANAQREMLTELVSRWTPDHLHDQPLEDELARIQDRTREFFDRVFAG